MFIILSLPCKLIMINFFTILESFPMNEIRKRQATGRKGIGVNYLIAKTWKSFFSGESRYHWREEENLTLRYGFIKEPN